MDKNECLIVKWKNNKYTAGDFDVTESILMIIKESIQKVLDEGIVYSEKFSNYCINTKMKQDDVRFVIKMRRLMLDELKEEHLGKVKECKRKLKNIFTDKFNKIIKQMVESGHKNITIRLYPEDNYFSLDSEQILDDKAKGG